MKDIVNQHIVDTYNTKNSGLTIKNLLDNRTKSDKIDVIKEEKNNISNSINDSILIESDIDNSIEEKDYSIIKNKIYEKYYGDKNSIFNKNSKSSSSKKNSNKIIMRANTSNFDNNFINKIINKNSSENMKLFINAKEKLLKKELEKKKTFKKENQNQKTENLKYNEFEKKIHWRWYKW